MYDLPLSLSLSLSLSFSLSLPYTHVLTNALTAPHAFVERKKEIERMHREWSSLTLVYFNFLIGKHKSWD
jgi:hypothetical protein